MADATRHWRRFSLDQAESRYHRRRLKVFVDDDQPVGIEESL
jgi:hypothetical protein